MAVTSTPIKIVDSQFSTVGTFYGPYQAGAALYVVVAESLPGGARINVYKSIDFGVTWTPQDSGSRPTVANLGSYTVIFDPAAINVLYGYNTPNVIGNARFSLSSDLFLSPVTQAVAHSSIAEQVSVRRSDGSIVLQYKIIDAGLEALYYNVFSGGSWVGGETLLTQGTVGQNLNGVTAVVDAFDTVHLIWELTVSFVDTGKYQTISSGGAASASVNLPISNFDFGKKVGTVWSGVLVFPYVDTVTFLAKTAFATGASTSPSSAAWSSVSDWISTLPGDSSNNAQAFPLIDGFGDLQVFFINTAPSAGNPKVYSVRWNGATFDSPVLFYDPDAFPPLGTIGSVFLFLISLALNSGAVQFVFSAAYGGPNASTFFVGGGTAAQSGYRNRIY